MYNFNFSEMVDDTQFFVVIDFAVLEFKTYFASSVNNFMINLFFLTY